MLGILGSAFNPPTLGHVDLIEQALLITDEVWLVPSLSHPWKSDLVDYDTRIVMLDELVKSNFPCGRVNVSRIEELINTETIYTWQVLEMISKEFKTNDITFICGPDVIHNWSKFERHKYIDENWRKSCLEERVQIRSSIVRDRIKNNKSIDGLVTTSINKIITKLNLYK